MNSFINHERCGFTVATRDTLLQGLGSKSKSRSERPQREARSRPANTKSSATAWRAPLRWSSQNLN